MRIRRNSKLSSMAAVPEVPRTHVCQLNQSPWDVIPFDHDETQLETEHSFTGNASLGERSLDSMGAVESVESLLNGSGKFIVMKNDNEVMAYKDGDSDENDVGECSEHPKEEHSFVCSDHRRSYVVGNDYYSNTSPITKKPAAANGSRRTRPPRAAAAAAGGGSNPYEFYYYSGFGPLWGKKRRERGEGKSMGGIHGDGTAAMGSGGFDYVEEEEDEVESGGDGGKKRMRKPVKARSLKSLM